MGTKKDMKVHFLRALEPWIFTHKFNSWVLSPSVSMIRCGPSQPYPFLRSLSLPYPICFQKQGPALPFQPHLCSRFCPFSFSWIYKFTSHLYSMHVHLASVFLLIQANTHFLLQPPPNHLFSSSMSQDIHLKGEFGFAFRLFPYNEDDNDNKDGGNNLYSVYHNVWLKGSQDTDTHNKETCEQTPKITGLYFF